jgi:signal transduction histidine kinase/DNA-binding response OmpR family regulator/ligand-binding sensor domain-containing protein
MIVMIKEDSHHRIWVGTWDSGLCMYDQERDRFVNFIPRPGDSTWLQGRTSYTMVEDSACGVWFCAPGGGGVVRATIDGSADERDVALLAQSIRFRTFSLGTPLNSSTDLLLHTDGTLLVASDSGLLVLDRATGAVSRPQLWGPGAERIPVINISRMTRDPAGHLWLMTAEGLFDIDWLKRRAINYRHADDDSLSISGDENLDIAADRRGNIWLASSRGLEMISARTGRRIPFIAYGPSPSGIASMDLAVDRAGTVWVSTGGYGVYWLSENSLRFNHFALRNPDGRVQSCETIERGKNSKYWVTAFGKVFQLDLNTMTAERVIEICRGDRPTYSQPNIRESFLDDKGALWYCSWGPGLYRVDLSNGGVGKYRYPNPSNGEAAVRSISRGSGDSLWIAAAHDGLWKFDPLSGRFFPGSSYRFPRANDVLRDREGRVWIATILDGLYRLNPSTGGLEHFVHSESNPKTLSNDHTNSLYEDPSGRIWFGAVSALNLWNPSSGSFTRYVNPAHQDANGVSAIGTDRKGRLWVAYSIWEEGGLASFDPGSQQWKSFDISDGLCGGIIDMENLENGSALLTGFGGVYMFNPDSVLAGSHPPPPLLFTKLIVNDSVLVPRPNGGVLSLTHAQDVLECEFAALDMDASAAIRYEYRMEGLEDNWIAPGLRRFVRYSGLLPGDYVFRVIATSLRDEWPPQELALAISIAPPLWRSRWAYAGYFFLAFAVLAGSYRLRRRQLSLRHQAEMDHFQAERLAEVDRLKNRFFANISHEFRTPLTLILGPAEQALASTTEADLREKLGLIRSNAKRLHALVNQLLDFSRLESGMMKLQVNEEDLVSFLRRTVLAFESWAERKRINLEFLADVAQLIGYCDADKLEKIVNNLVSNALKFTPEGGNVVVRVSGLILLPPFSTSEEERGGVSFSVADSGPGIAQEHLPRIFDRFYRVEETHAIEGTGIGLALTQELVELHHGTISVRSAPGEHTAFTVMIPIEERDYSPAEIAEAGERDQNKVNGGARDSAFGENVVNGGFTSSQPGNAAASTKSTDLPVILIVEDNADLRAYLREYFSGEYSVRETADGNEGFAAAVDIIPDLVISDVLMPGLDGLELCKALKQDLRTSHVPVILLTARAGTDNKIEGLETGADDYMTKPFEAPELMARARNLIDQRRRLRARFSEGILLNPGEVAISSRDDALLKKVMEIVELRMGDENLGVEEIAGAVALSRRHLDRKLMVLTNLSAADFIKQMRLQRAHELLEKKAASIAEIAYMVGFRSPSYFTASFRERFGRLPSDMVRPRT